MTPDEWREVEPFIQSLGERLLKAGWATDFIIMPEGVRFTATRKGRIKLRQFWNAVKELGIQEISDTEIGFLRFLANKEALRCRWK